MNNPHAINTKMATTPAQYLDSTPARSPVSSMALITSATPHTPITVDNVPANRNSNRCLEFNDPIGDFATNKLRFWNGHSNYVLQVYPYSGSLGTAGSVSRAGSDSVCLTWRLQYTA
jgi:hypothetical protein